MQNKDKGKQGEKIAVEYLKKDGYKILDVNFHYSKYAEIDIIASKNDEIIFVEVKTRTSNKFGEPIEAVDNRKLQNIILASKYYIQKKGITAQKPRIDVISIILNEKEFKIAHIKNVTL